MDALPYKENIRWTRIVARCLLTECDRIDIFLRRGGEEFLIRAEQTVRKGASTGSPTDIIAPGDYKVCARFDRPAATSECELYAYGVVQRLDPRE